MNVAVIGGGIAGITTTLELLRRATQEAAAPSINKITLIEQASRTGHADSASGAVSATMCFANPSNHWNDFTDATTWEYDASERLARFAKNYASAAACDCRTKADSIDMWFVQAQTRLETILDTFPELCPAVAGPFCCRPGSPAMQWLQTENRTEQCRETGILHVFKDLAKWEKANTRTSEEKNYTTLNAPLPLLAALGDDAHQARGALLDAVRQGFIRTSNFYRIAQRIFDRHGELVHSLTGCNVARVARVAPPATNQQQNLQIVMACGDVRDEANNTHFDRVVVANGVSSVKLLQASGAGVDLADELFPVKGFALYTESEVVPQDERNLGIIDQTTYQYIAPQNGGGVKLGFGKIFGTFDDELLTPTWTGWDDVQGGPKESALGRALLNDIRTERAAGYRPLGMYGAFPVIRSWQNSEHDGMFLNTGGGFYGFSSSWQAAYLVADLVLHGESSQPEWELAYDTPARDEHEHSVLAAITGDKPKAQVACTRPPRTSAASSPFQTRACASTALLAVLAAHVLSLCSNGCL